MKTKTKTCRYCRALRGGVETIKEKVLALARQADITLENEKVTDDNLIIPILKILYKKGCIDPKIDKEYYNEQIKYLLPDYSDSDRVQKNFLVARLLPILRRCVNNGKLFETGEATSLLMDVETYTKENNYFNFPSSTSEDNVLVYYFFEKLQKLQCVGPEATPTNLFPSFNEDTGTNKELVLLLVDKIKNCMLNKRLKQLVREVDDMNTQLHANVGPVEEDWGKLLDAVVRTTKSLSTFTDEKTMEIILRPINNPENIELINTTDPADIKKK